MQENMQDNELLDIEKIKPLNNKDLEDAVNLIERIEKAKQVTALEQIKSIDKDNERQFEFAKLTEENENKKWNKSFWAGVIATATLTIVSIVLIFKNEDKSIGLGLLATTFSGVFGFIAGAGSCKNK